jgi:mycofactocin precursor
MENDTVTTEAPASTLADAATPGIPVVAVEEELLVEEISIDGMCGVY